MSPKLWSEGVHHRCQNVPINKKSCRDRGCNKRSHDASVNKNWKHTSTLWNLFLHGLFLGHLQFFFLMDFILIINYKFLQYEWYEWIWMMDAMARHEIASECSKWHRQQKSAQPWRVFHKFSLPQHYSIFRACHPCHNCIKIVTLQIWSCTERLKNKARNTPRCDWRKSGHDSKLWYLGIYFSSMEELFHKKGVFEQNTCEQGRSMMRLTYLVRIPWSHHQMTKCEN